MQAQTSIGRLDHLTFKGNGKQTRYGWLRLTPAYSVHFVADLLEKQANENSIVLDPFCGTGTTALVCAERGIACDTTDINPFLIWLAQVKANSYTTSDLAAFKKASAQIIKAILDIGKETVWLPDLHQIEKWWDDATLQALGRVICEIKKISESEKVCDLLKIAFCRTLIEHANVSFGHQSMSFKKGTDNLSLAFADGTETFAAATWERAIDSITEAAASTIITKPSVLLCDARNMSEHLHANHYTCVITSPPYPNRMSYIRELRPYMYWLGYLQDKRSAGELDWQAIGGTWGCATSNLTKWQPENKSEIPFAGFDEILARISEQSHLLARYVAKYFHDMTTHCRELFKVVKTGGQINYIVGNSKFYDVMLPVEEIFASLFTACGFENVSIEKIRKRTSKKELFEFVVSAKKLD